MGLKDVRVGNKLGNPVQFAFSTGNKIDNCKIKGRVFSKNEGYTAIFAYQMDNKITANPEKQNPDYFAILNSERTYFLNNLSKGRYRLFAVKDIDRNFLFDKDFEEIAMTDKDVDVIDTSDYYNADFLMMNLNFNALDVKNLSSFSSDSLKIIYSSIKSGTVSVPIDYKFYFLFKTSDLSKYEIADNISLVDTVRKINLKLIYNWLTDSLLEVFPLEKLNYGSTYDFRLDFRNTKRKYFYSIQYSTFDEKKFSKISGIISKYYETGTQICVNLIDVADPLNRYNISLKNDSIFVFNRIPVGDYYLFAFLDKNSDNIFEKGSYEPFVASEKFYLTDKALKVTGRMDYEKIYINFGK